MLYYLIRNNKIEFNDIFIFDLEKDNQISDNSTDVKSLDLGIIVSEDKRIYEDRIAELVADRILADSKATHFFLECMALQKKIQSREMKAVRTCFTICNQ